MTSDAYKIGVVLPFSGSEANSGVQCLNGAKMAVKEINESGGVLGGRHIELVVEDSETDPQRALERTRKLVAVDGVQAILGPLLSTSRDQMIGFLAEHRIPLLYGTDYEGGAYNRYLFCYSAIPEHYARPVVPHMIQHYGDAFYLLGSDYVWPRKTNEYVKDILVRKRATLSGEEYFPFGHEDFQGVIDRIADSGATVIFLDLVDSELRAFLRQCHTSGLKEKLRIVALAFNESTLASLGREEAEGILTCNHFFATLDCPEAREFVRRQQQMFGEDTWVSYYNVSHYGLVKFFGQAVKKAGTEDVEKIIDLMADQSLVVANGQVTLRGSDHHMILNILIAEVKDGCLTVVKAVDSLAPADQHVD
ncbi:substrate-binding protein [Desulfobacula sp.]|uniref:substrate-binding protein n=1 Tax=Desulfobacula sp. TaxID=2593537 RepID=UPI002616C3AC|nr:substrate-binding protein [Desulfobacula sp.]